ncbi:MAG TPA: FtsQ-type POTRA domain-containing protein [Herpetosiphonaceae bacterium]|nr:FtsQ-type POTRA domain-containing protein [Herpetosiphonaceae bacterium]
MSRSERKPSRVATRTPRPRAMVGQSRRAEPMVRPMPRTTLRRSVINGKLGALITLIAGMWALWYVFRSPNFIVQGVETLGLRSVDAAAVNDLAAVGGISVWNIRPDDVANRIGQNTYVATATVNVLLPNRVIVQVQERQAAVVWNAAGVNYEVTGDGEVLGPVSVLTGTNIMINDTRTQPLTPGMRIDVDALNLAQTLHLRVPAELGWTPTRYEWDPYYGLSIYNQGQQVVFGRMEDPDVPFDLKLTTLRTLQRERTAWIFLDLRPNKPYYRSPAPPPTPTPEL